MAEFLAGKSAPKFPFGRYGMPRAELTRVAKFQLEISTVNSLLITKTLCKDKLSKVYSIGLMNNISNYILEIFPLSKFCTVSTVGKQNALSQKDNQNN